jgi:sugar O-acyltransferase (sialic acid O-acetyltransferase NeuD family)
MTKQLVIVSIDQDLIDLLLSESSYEIIGVIDRNSSSGACGLPVLGSDEQWHDLQRRYPGIGVVLAVDPCAKRKRLAGWYGLDRLVFVRGEGSYVSPRASFGRGVIIQRGVTVSAGVVIGDACKLNIDAAVHHDCQVGDFCTLAPGSRLLGNVQVGAETYVGAGAVVLPRVRIGAGAIIGAGAVVTQNVPDGMTMIGVPARGRMTT